MTQYSFCKFTKADAAALIGKHADITEWDGDEGERKITYKNAKVIGVISNVVPYLNIATAGAEVSDAETGDLMTTQPAKPDWNVALMGICEVTNVH